MITRKRLFEIINAELDRWGYDDVIIIEHGKIGFELSVQDGRETISIKERETTKTQELRHSKE